MVTSVVCLANGHRKLYARELLKLDVQCLKLLRRTLVLPAFVNWNGPWHEILHTWHVRIGQLSECSSFNFWSTKCLEICELCAFASG